MECGAFERRPFVEVRLDGLFTELLDGLFLAEADRSVLGRGEDGSGDERFVKDF